MPYFTTRKRSLSRTLRSRLRSIEIGFHPIVGGLMLVLFGFHLLLFQEDQWWGDAYQYLMHAENLLSGTPYAETGYIPSPHNFIAPAAYPIGYPLLLALVLPLIGTSAAAHAALASVLLLGTAWITATLARGWLPDAHAAVLAVLVGLQPSLIQLGWSPRSDPLFMFLVMLCLLAAERASYRSSRSVRWAVVAGVAAAAALATRSLGLLLFPALLLSGLVRERSIPRHTWISLGVGLVLFGAISLYDVGEPTTVASAETAVSPGYTALVQENVLDQLRDIPERIPARASDYIRGSYEIWRIPGHGVFKHLVMVLAVGIVLFGFAYRSRKRFGPAETFAPLYVASLLPWTFYYPRYLYPVYPLYYLYLVVGVWRMSRSRPARLWGSWTALLGLALFSFSWQFMEWTQIRPRPAVPADHAAMFHYIRGQTPKDAIFVTSADPRGAIYHTRRRATHGPDDLSTWNEYAAEIGAEYALTEADDEIVTALQSDSHHELVQATDGMLLFARCPEGCIAATE
ncbi:MAG: hypothetical protein Rubg2KO_25620 [Rubricoccaceae bacterium]